MTPSRDMSATSSSVRSNAGVPMMSPGMCSTMMAPLVFFGFVVWCGGGTAMAVRWVDWLGGGGEGREIWTTGWTASQSNHSINQSINQSTHATPRPTPPTPTPTRTHARTGAC